jgi:uncharacterized RDD family membrane protein YckC
LKDYLKAGNLRFSDLVWFDGVAEWVPLSKIPGVADGLSSLGSAAPPPPKPPPAPAAPAIPPLIQTAPTEPKKLVQKEVPVDVNESSNSDGDEMKEDMPSDKPDFETKNLAPHGARLVAGLVDGIILFSVIGVLLSIAGAVAGVVAYFLLGWLYYGLGESSQAGGFIGKRMSKIRVVRLSDDNVPSFGLSTSRALLKIVLSLTVVLPFIVFFTPRRQGIHDLICGTVVRGTEEEN